MKKIYIAFFALLTTVGCTKPEATQVENYVYLNLKAKSSTPNEGDKELTEAKSLAIYICQNGAVQWLSRLSLGNMTKLQIPAKYVTGGTLYVVANETVVVNEADIAVGTSQTVIDALYSSCAKGAGASNLYAMFGKSDLTGATPQTPIVVALNRNMARFDVVPTDSNIHVQSLKVTGLPMEGRLADNNGRAFSKATHDISMDLTTSTGIFYSHEFTAEDGFQLRVDVVALYGEVEVKASLDIAKATRNKVLKLQLNQINGEMELDLVTDDDMEDWEDLPLSPDKIIYVDPAKSQIPTDVTLDNPSRLNIPSKGSEVVLALQGVDDITYFDYDVPDYVKVATQADGRFKVTVDPTRNMGSSEVVMLKFGRPTQFDKDTHSKIELVIDNYAPFEVVTMCGVDWMIVNAQGKKDISYPLSGDAKSTRELFKKNWSKWGGIGEQWGPRAGKNGNGVIIRYEPGFWTFGVNYNGINGPIVNDATMWDKHDYCPDGWRAPLREEVAAIWPTAGMIVNDTLPGPYRYTTSQGDFTVTFEKLGGNCLVINDGVNELIFPLMGMRSAWYHFFNGVNSPSWAQTARDVGQSVYYWTADREKGINPTVFGYAGSQMYTWPINPMSFMVNNQVMTSHSWSSDAFCTTRCVRKAKH